MEILRKMKKSFYPLIWVGVLAVIACALLVCERDFLWKIQEASLFLRYSAIRALFSDGG